jgi:hypothetical protein
MGEETGTLVHSRDGNPFAGWLISSIGALLSLLDCFSPLCSTSLNLSNMASNRFGSSKNSPFL